MHKMHTPFLSRGGVVPPGSLRVLPLSPAGAPSAGISFMHVFLAVLGMSICTHSSGCFGFLIFRFL